MAWPDYATTLDEFTYENGNLPDVSTDWSTVYTYTVVIVINNQALNNTSNGIDCSAYIETPTTYADVHAYLTMAVIPEVAEGRRIRIFARGITPDSAKKGYCLEIVNYSSTWYWLLQSQDGATETEIDSGTISPSNGHKIGISCEGNQISAWYNDGGGWDALGSSPYTNSVYDGAETNERYVGFSVNDITARIDDFYWGSGDGGATEPAYGYATPDAPEVATSWTTWHLGSGAVVTGDADYGTLSIPYGIVCASPVIDMGDADSKTITVTCPKYGSNSGSVTKEYRGSATTFAWDAGSPSWSTYSAPVQQSWRYFQVRLTGA